MSENIEVISIVDRYLEHPRLYIFENGGKQKVYISSADFMTRNIENRVEVAAPIYDVSLKKQIIDVFDIIWMDNVKSRIINKKPQNKFRKTSDKPVRSQWAIYDYYKKL
jgi:polyphosphate kinase